MLDGLFHCCAWKDDFAFNGGTMRLMPPEYNLDKLRDDYEHMQNMLFGDKPSFGEIMKSIAKLEAEINQI